MPATGCNRHGAVLSSTFAAAVAEEGLDDDDELAEHCPMDSDALIRPVSRALAGTAFFSREGGRRNSVGAQLAYLDCDLNPTPDTSKRRHLARANTVGHQNVTPCQVYASPSLSQGKEEREREGYERRGDKEEIEGTVCAEHGVVESEIALDSLDCSRLAGVLSTPWMPCDLATGKPGNGNGEVGWIHHPPPQLIAVTEQPPYSWERRRAETRDTLQGNFK